MKRITTILLLTLFVTNANGQKDTNSKIIFGGTGMVSATINNNGGAISSYLKSVNDTVKVIMLYSDTVSFYNKTYSDGQRSANLKFEPDWMYGYMVTPYINHFDNSRIANGTSTYLDNNKSPLKKTIIVWLSKQL